MFETKYAYKQFINSWNPKLGRLRRIFVFLAIMATGFLNAQASPTNKTTLLDKDGSLQSAVEYLTSTYSERYPQGGKFLERLDLLEKRFKKIVVSKNSVEVKDVSAKFQSLRREALLANPLLTKKTIVFVVRHQYKPDHHNTGTMFLTTEVNAASFRGGGAIKTIDFAKAGKVETLLDLPQGVARDLDVAFDGDKFLFAMRSNSSENYHIFEMNADGNGQKQLTFKPGVADIDPIYLPDGRIVFSSTRDPKYCGCNQHIQVNLFRMNADGSNMHQIGRNNLFESRPSLMPDGRVLYDRWEYVDRHYGPSFGLWTSAPDGCNHALYYGNNAWSPGAIFDARVLPGTQLVTAVLGACHDRPWGAMVIIDRRRGLDGLEPLVHTWPPNITKHFSNRQQYNQGQDQYYPGWRQIDLLRHVPFKYEDPMPLDSHFILCARTVCKVQDPLKNQSTGIYLVDTFGNELLLHAEDPASELGCFDPMPLAPRQRPRIVPDRVDLTQKIGTFYVTNVYEGTHMEGVKPGTIKTLRIIESPPKRHQIDPLWRGDTLQRPAMSYNCTNNKRILGDVPVESDGSAFFEVPADRFIYFQALDANGKMIQSMRSGTTLRPGEYTGCIGCHDRRYDSVGPVGMPTSKAMRRAPSPLKPWYGPTRAFNYLTEIQPIFDKQCVSCHDYGKEAGKVLNLAGDLGLAFNTSYLEIRNRSPRRWFPDPEGSKKQLIKPIDDGPPEVLPAYAWGAHRSRFIDVLQADHYGVKLDQESLDRLITWIDLNTPYYGTYECNFPNNLFGRSPLSDSQLEKIVKLTGIQVNHVGMDPIQGTQINFTRPELSPCLAKFKDKKDPKYRKALAIIQAGSETLRRTTRADMSNFTLVNTIDQKRNALRQQCQAEEAAARQAIIKGKKYFRKQRNHETPSP